MTQMPPEPEETCWLVTLDGHRLLPLLPDRQDGEPMEFGDGSPMAYGDDTPPRYGKRDGGAA